jgi:hypothetical protein
MQADLSSVGTWLRKKQTSCTPSASSGHSWGVCRHTRVLLRTADTQALRLGCQHGACAHEQRAGEAARQSATGSLCGCVEPGPSSTWCCYPVGAWCAPVIVFDEATRCSAGSLHSLHQRQLQGRLQDQLP